MATLEQNQVDSCALQLTFLSDGRPSDRIKAGALGLSVEDQLVERVGQIASSFGRRLTVGVLGFGGAPGEFGTLRAMAEAAEEFGSVGVFQHVSLSAGALGKAMSTLTSTLTTAKTEMTVRHWCHSGALAFAHKLGYSYACTCGSTSPQGMH